MASEPPPRVRKLAHQTYWAYSGNKKTLPKARTKRLRESLFVRRECCGDTMSRKAGRMCCRAPGQLMWAGGSFAADSACSLTIPVQHGCLSSIWPRAQVHGHAERMGCSCTRTRPVYALFFLPWKRLSAILPHFLAKNGPYRLLAGEFGGGNALAPPLSPVEARLLYRS